MPEYSLTRLRGEWAVAWWEDTIDASGRPRRRRHRISLGTADRKEAEVEAARRWADLTRPEKITVAYLWEEYRREKAQKRIAANMVFSGKAILPALGHMQPEDLTPDVCRAYAATRRRAGRKAGTVWTEMNHLQIVLNWAHKRRRIPHEVALLRPSKPAPRDRRLTAAETRRLLDAAAEQPHIQVAISLMVNTGARVGAILDLTWDRVDFERRQITYAKPEEGVARKGRATVPMNADLLATLMKARKSAVSEYVVEWAGRQIGSVKRGFARAVENAGLLNVTPHVIRHTAATLMAERGVPMTKIAAVLGHSDSRTTERIYAKFTPGHLQDAVDALDTSGVPSVTTEPGAGNKK